MLKVIQQLWALIFKLTRVSGTSFGKLSAVSLLDTFFLEIVLQQRLGLVHPDFYKGLYNKGVLFASSAFQFTSKTL